MRFRIDLQPGENWRQLLKKISHKIASDVADADQISKAVLRSQPPHASDVPEMVAWSLKWSGGSSAFWTKELCHFCSVKGVPSDLHVPGRIFGALAKLDFGTQMPARGIAAILKRVATSKKVTDSCASDVRVSDIMAIQRPNMKEIFVRASGIMERCSKALASKGIQDPQATLDMGALECSLIDLVLSKPDEATATAKMDELVTAWMQNLFGDDSGDTSAGSSAASSTAAAQATAACVEYDQKGEAQNVGKLALQARGITENSTFTNKLMEYAKLTRIESDGSCVLQYLDAYGNINSSFSEFKIPGSDFLATWKPFSKAFTMDTIATKHINMAKQLKESLDGQRVKHAIFALALEMKQYSLIHRLSPTKAVFAQEAYDTDSVLIAPFGSVYQFDFAAPNNKGIKAPDDRSKVQVQMPCGAVATYIMQPSPPDEKTQVSYWAISSTHSEDLANMKIVHRDVRFVLPTTGKLRIAGHEYVVQIPCFQNYKPIKKDDELMYYVPKPAKAKSKAVVPELKLPAAKKHKRV